MAGVIILSYAFRWAYDWDHIFTDKVFKGLTNWLGLFTLLFTWLQLQQIITGVFAAPTDVTKVTFAKLTNPVYITLMSITIIVLGYVFAQAVSGRVFSKNRSLVASFAILLATLSEKVLFVYEGLEYPTFDLYRAVPGHYVPSIIELLSLAGTTALLTIFFLVIAKVVPVVELHAVEDHEDHGDHGDHDEEEVSA
jgi:molybdopterin-containing oxidoreductase family membrane subunit